jgi:hypothetical protein
VDDAKRIGRFDHGDNASEHLFGAWITHDAVDLKALMPPEFSKLAVSFCARFRPVFEQSILTTLPLNALDQSRPKRVALRAPKIIVGQFEQVFE